MLDYFIIPAHPSDLPIKHTTSLPEVGHMYKLEPPYRAGVVIVELLLVHVYLFLIVQGLEGVRVGWMHHRRGVLEHMMRKVLMLNYNCLVLNWRTRMVYRLMIMVRVCYPLLRILTVTSRYVVTVTIVTITIVMVTADVVTMVIVTILMNTVLMVPIMMVDVVLVTLVLVGTMMVLVVIVGRSMVNMVDYSGRRLLMVVNSGGVLMIMVVMVNIVSMVLSVVTASLGARFLVNLMDNVGRVVTVDVARIRGSFYLQEG